MTTATVDTERIKNGLDLRELAGRYVTLRRESATEQSGPCPKCGGEDRFHVAAEWFFCRGCHDKRGDAFDLVQFLGLAHNFPEAAAWLGGAAMTPAPAEKGTPKAKPKPSDWKSPTWQREARAELARAQALLASPAGDPGAEYLFRRGILVETWEAWRLGFDPARFDPKAQRTRPAVVLPWQRDRITALKYRFIDDDPGGLRYVARAGGECIAFGLGLAGTHDQTLWLLEGEINALALWQALRGAGAVNFDVVSFGAEGRATSPVILALARKYRQVILWADKPEVASAAIEAIPGAFGLRSPTRDGRKLDAAELGRLGLLADFARAARAKFDADPAYLAKIRAEVDG